MSMITQQDGIDIAYPVAGQDNDSQGFRDNFSAIKSAFDEADTNLTSLSNRAVISSTVAGDPALNDLNYSTLFRGNFKRLHGLATSTTIIMDPDTDLPTTTVDLSNGPLQTLVYTTDSPNPTALDITFTNWKHNADDTIPVFAYVRLHIINTSTRTTPTLNYGSENGGVVLKDATNLPPSTLLTNKQVVLEAWSYDGGLNVYIQLIGTYTAV